MDVYDIAIQGAILQMDTNIDFLGLQLEPIKNYYVPLYKGPETNKENGTFRNSTTKYHSPKEG